MMIVGIESGNVYKVGDVVRFGDLWDGDGDGISILKSGAISPDNDVVVAFSYNYIDSDLLNTLIRIEDIF